MDPHWKTLLVFIFEKLAFNPKPNRFDNWIQHIKTIRNSPVSGIQKHHNFQVTF